MRKLNGLKWLFALAVINGTANADLIIDNQSIPAAEINTISISPSSGNIFVTTLPGYAVTKAVVGSNVTVTGFTLSPSTIVAGASTTISWSVANADSCTASGGIGTWAGSVISLPSGSKSITTSTVGSHQFTLTCSGPVGGPAVANVILDVNAAGAVSIGSFAASPSAIVEGGSTTLSWTTSNASSCTASNGTGGWSGSSVGLPSGTKVITIATAGNYTFTLTCVDASGGQDVVSTIVEVSPDNSPQCPAPKLSSGSQLTWKSFWLQDFPDPGYDSRYITIPRYSYVALKFNSGNVVADGKVTTIETTITDGLRLGAISECPGEFNVANLCKKSWGISGGIRWATNGRSDACQLQPNTDYYLNLTFTDGVSSSTSTCYGSPCVTNLVHSYR